MKRHTHDPVSPQIWQALGVFAAALALLVLNTVANAESENSLRNRIKIHKKSHLVVGHEGDSEEFNLEKYELLAAKRRRLMLDIRRVLASHHDKEQKEELNMRLGSLYIEDYYGRLAKAQKIFQEASARFKVAPEKFHGHPPKFDNSEATSSLETARGIYHSLLMRYPKSNRRDEMFYFLAVAASEKARISEAMSYYKRLVSETPKSKYVNEALIQLADYNFDNNNFEEAEKYYDRLIARKHRPLMAYAVYKKAWCAYNTKRTDLALKDFKWVIAHEATEDPAAPVHVKKEALRDITLPFVDLKLVDESVAFFKPFGAPYYRQGLETMASLYQESGDYKNSRALYKILLDLDPNYPQNPPYEIAIIEGLRLQSQEKEAVNRLLATVPNYLKNSNWYEINVSNPKAPNAIAEANRAFEELTRKYAFDDHAHAQKLKSDAMYNDAKVLYSKYLEFFPHTTHAAQVHFYLAEILYKQNQFVPAADHYFAAYGEPGVGNLRYDSLHYAVMSLDHELNNERRKQGLDIITSKTTSKLKAKEEEDLKLIPYSPVESKFVKVSAEYLKVYPKSKDAADVLYEQAYLLYSHHELVEAYKSFWMLVQTYPSHETAIASAHLILDILNRKKDYPKLIAACQRFLQNKAFTKPEFRAEIADVLRHAELKRIQLVEQAGDYGRAAHDYVEYTKQYGEQDQALFEKALYNASVDYSKASNFLAAVETQEQFLRVFPKSSLRESMLLQVAKTYELFANFEKAANYFEQFANTYPQNTQAQSALRLAGLYFWGSGYSTRAENVMLSFLKRYPKDAKLVERDLIDLYESQGSVDKEIALFNRLRLEKGVTYSDAVTDMIRIAELEGKKNGKMPLRLMEETRDFAERNASSLASSPKGVEARAKVLFWFASREEADFMAIKLVLPQATMEKNLARKIALLQDVEKQYARVAKLGGEWGLGAIYKTAAAYRHLANEVMQAPIPSELSGEQVDNYRKELQKQMIKPFNEKALGMAAQCLDKAQEYNLLTSWTPRCYSLAAELQPDHYPLVRTFYLPPLQVALMMPDKEKSKIAMGDIPSYPYPYYSSGMFGITPQGGDRNVASAPMDIPLLYDGTRELSEVPGIIPGALNYRALASTRKSILRKNLEDARPADLRKGTNFAYLHLMRLVYPDRSQNAILEAIQKDPSNQALHNLLGLAYLEAGNLPAARVTWLAMVAEGVKNPVVWNNLGVASLYAGNEVQAMDFFHEAASSADVKEPLINLGYLALKYRNGFEAKKEFEKAVELDRNDASASVGLAVGLLQNREMSDAKSSLADLSKKLDHDPYVRLSLTYYLVDVERENQMAEQMLSRYMDTASLENDIIFRQALQEAKHAVAGEASSADGGLPTIEQ